MKDKLHHHTKTLKKVLHHLLDNSKDVSFERTLQDSMEQKRKKEKLAVKKETMEKPHAIKSEDQRNSEKRKRGLLREGNVHVH